MNKLILPCIVFLLGLIIVDYFFKIDVMEMLEGTGDFIMSILKGPGND